MIDDLKKKIIIIIVISICILVLSRTFKVGSDILLLLSVVVIILFFGKNKYVIEKFDGNIDIEALQNLASMYNDGNLKVSNLNVTGDITATGNITASKGTGMDVMIGKQTVKVADSRGAIIGPGITTPWQYGLNTDAIVPYSMNVGKDVVAYGNIVAKGNITASQGDMQVKLGKQPVKVADARGSVTGPGITTPWKYGLNTDSILPYTVLPQKDMQVNGKITANGVTILNGGNLDLHTTSNDVASMYGKKFTDRSGQVGVQMNGKDGNGNFCTKQIYC